MKYAMRRVFAAVLLLGIASVPASGQESAAGAWELTLQTPQGPTSVTMTLKIEGDQATGDLTSQIGSLPITGTVASGAVAMSGKLEIQGVSLAFAVNGKLEGEALNGTMKMGDFGEFPFTGKRADAVAAATAGAGSAAPVAAVGDGSAAGKWNITLTIAGAGQLPVTADLKQDGTTVTGTLSSLAGEVAVKGTMIGILLQLEFTVVTPQGALPITMTGELGANGAFTGKASLLGVGEADWTGVREQ